MEFKEDRYKSTFRTGAFFSLFRKFFSIFRDPVLTHRFRRVISSTTNAS